MCMNVDAFLSAFKFRIVWKRINGIGMSFVLCNFMLTSITHGFFLQNANFTMVRGSFWQRTISIIVIQVAVIVDRFPCEFFLRGNCGRLSWCE